MKYTNDEYKNSQYDGESPLPPRSEFHKEKSRIPRFLIDLISIIFNAAIIIGIFFIVQYFFFASVKVEGNSMNPTFDSGDRLILNKIASIERFDIVVFKAPDTEPGKNVQYIKRVIGVPGDKVEMREDTLYINDKEMNEKYLPADLIDSLSYYYTNDFDLLSLLGEEKVPEDTYFVLGDNRLNSKDSRSFGFIDKDSVIGKISLRYWPINHFDTY
ncbi:signal peptidase I [Allofustis seminis]|uniref:signal peptidase I n=1 Tax=Allofustis seminis TaxID=166939 RepID=UPI0003677D18|nr:signal peptidase I [Allofustis seminis]